MLPEIPPPNSNRIPDGTIYHAFALKVDLLSEWAAELVKARVDVIATAGDLASRAAQQATKTIPILALPATCSGQV